MAIEPLCRPDAVPDISVNVTGVARHLNPSLLATQKSLRVRETDTSRRVATLRAAFVVHASRGLDTRQTSCCTPKIVTEWM